jgi:FAD synthetase
MVFGTFDGFHEGHRAFVRQARTCGDYLIAVVAHDLTVKQLKQTFPKMNLDQRCDSLRGGAGIDEVVAGDAELGVWKVLEEHRPDVVAIGYDQHRLKEALENHFTVLDTAPEIRVMKFYGYQKKGIER